MRILFDIDDTLCGTSVEWTKATYEYFDKLGIERNRPKSKDTYRLEESYNLTPQQKCDYFNTMNNSEFFATMEPLPGAVVMMKQLARNHEILLITARPIQLDDITNKWVSEKLGLDVDVHFVNDFPVWLKYQRIDVLIDNSVQRCLTAKENGITSYLYCGSLVDGDIEQANEIEKLYHYADVIKKIKEMF